MVNQTGSQAGVGRRHCKSNRKQQDKVPLHCGDVSLEGKKKKVKENEQVGKTLCCVFHCTLVRLALFIHLHPGVKEKASMGKSSWHQSKMRAVCADPFQATIIFFFILFPAGPTVS